MVHCAALTDRSCLRVKGADARHFLQNLVTCDIDSLGDGDVTFGALLTPQGKVLFDFFIRVEGDGFLFDCPTEARDGLLQRLTFYKLRADVTVEPDDDTAVFAVWGGSDHRGDGRRPEMGDRLYREAPAANATLTEYHRHRMSLGVPEAFHDFDYGDVFPHDVLMDQCQPGGVDFAKGCYVGQEVVSRMKHRASARNRFVKVSAGSDLPPKGTPILASERQVGTMGGSDGLQGLALVRIDKVAKAVANDLALTANGVSVSLELPAFASFSLSVEAEA